MRLRPESSLGHGHPEDEHRCPLYISKGRLKLPVGVGTAARAESVRRVPATAIEASAAQILKLSGEIIGPACAGVINSNR
jgi:hypothetical protein